MTGFAAFIQGHRGDPGDRPDPLQRARMAVDKADQEFDEDERQANLLTRGYAPGLVSDLAQRYAEKKAELATVRDENEAARTAQERIAREHAAGRITAFDIMRMDAGEPDVARERQLERQAESLLQQFTDAQALIAPAAQRDPDPVEAATSRARQAHRQFAESTRAAVAAAEAGTRVRAPRPFAVRGAGGGEPACAECRKAGATADQSSLIHSGRVPPERGQVVRVAGTNYAYDRVHDELERVDSRRGYNELAGPSITRTVGYDDSGTLGNYGLREICR